MLLSPDKIIMTMCWSSVTIKYFLSFALPSRLLTVTAAAAGPEHAPDIALQSDTDHFNGLLLFSSAPSVC